MGGLRTRITSRDRWCILADSGNPFHAPDESSVRVGMCALPVCDRCGRTGVRPVSFSEVEEEGGRKHIVTWNDAPAVLPATDAKSREGPQGCCFTGKFSLFRRRQYSGMSSLICRCFDKFDNVKESRLGIYCNKNKCIW